MQEGGGDVSASRVQSNGPTVVAASGLDESSRDSREEWPPLHQLTAAGGSCSQ